MKRKDAFTKAQWKQDTYRVCKECTTQKREAGTPYRCTQCGLWHAACHFASKHQNPRWSMYRVCLTCDTVKQCCVCKTKPTKEHFGPAAWNTRKPERRVCLQCQTKTRGSWKCAYFPCLSPSGPLEKMERRCATHAALPLCRMLSANVLPRLP